MYLIVTVSNMDISIIAIPRVKTTIPVNFLKVQNDRRFFKGTKIVILGLFTLQAWFNRTFDIIRVYKNFIHTVSRIEIISSYQAFQHRS